MSFYGVTKEERCIWSYRNLFHITPALMKIICTEGQPRVTHNLCGSNVC